MALDIRRNTVHRHGFSVYLHGHGSEGTAIVSVHPVLSEKPTKTKSIFFNCGDFPERKPLLMAKVSEGLMVPRPLRFSAAIAYEAKK